MRCIFPPSPPIDIPPAQHPPSHSPPMTRHQLYFLELNLSANDVSNQNALAYIWYQAMKNGVPKPTMENAATLKASHGLFWTLVGRVLITC